MNLTNEYSISIINDTDFHLPFSWIISTSDENFPESNSFSICDPDKAPDLDDEDHVTYGAFSLKPRTGRVWARSKRTIRAEFNPDHAKLYAATALCKIAGR